jgi:hypothetical protein
MIVSLSRQYLNRFDVPVIEQVDTAIFERTCSTHCASCAFCNDACCAFGVCVDLDNVRRIEACADRLERFLEIPRDQWFTEQHVHDPEFPGGSYIRTRVVAGACVFLNRSGRGCLLHAFCLAEGVDHHLLKPMLSSVFPVTAEAGLLRPAAEVADESLACLDGGLSLYRGARGDLRYYYGDTLIRELDQLETRDSA